ncbi:MAG: sodium:proton antiporter [Prevotella sp.]|nr:sodium:proton antiporter [Prevotella sp.]
MTLVIVTMLLVGYLLIATSHVTNVNKAAIAMFIGTVGWVIYICYGADFVAHMHPREYIDFLAGQPASSMAVKHFIYDDIFLKYVAKAAAVILFLLATMSIIEILNNNGCFDFIREWVRTRSSKRLLWTISLATFVISANLDNLTTTTMMLMIMRNIVQSRRQRMLIGSSIVLAANAGGCMTVIGDPAGVFLWGSGAVTASNFSSYLILPSILAWAIPTLLLSLNLPDRLDATWLPSPFRGDDTNLNRWQRLVMLFVGIGGLWFIPTFHNITKLSPFLGALCVLSILWVVNELFNRKLMNADQLANNRLPRVLQYGSIQQILFVMGVMLALGAVKETGAWGDMATWLDFNIHNVWAVGILSGLMSGLVDTFTIAMSNFSLYPVVDEHHLNLWADSDYMTNFIVNGAYWKITAFSTAIGGCLLCFANTSGLALMKMEHVRIGWYVKNCTPKVLLGWAVGLAVLYLEIYLAEM